MKINGTAKNGAFAMGGDVIVRGTVDGDVAAIGGSVIQLEGARINGDVMVVGGTYRYADKEPLRGPGTQTIIYTGYEHELRSLMRNPRDLLAPRWSAAYIGLRLLAILFWFIVSLALTAAMPGTISRGIARLQLHSWARGDYRSGGFSNNWPRVLSCRFTTFLTPSGLLIGLMALLLIVVALLFGRVIIYAATGRWLQRKLLKNGGNSEVVALVLGTTFWIALSSLPYIWPVVVAVLLVTSLGLAPRPGIEWAGAGVRRPRPSQIRTRNSKNSNEFGSSRIKNFSTQSAGRIVQFFEQPAGAPQQATVDFPCKRVT